MSLRKAADSKLSADCFIKRNHVPIEIGTGYKNNPQKISSSKKNKISEYVIDETVFKVGSEYI